MKTYKVVLTSSWMDIKPNQEVYVSYGGNTKGLENKLNNNSQFSGALYTELVRGDFSVHEELTSWLNAST